MQIRPAKREDFAALQTIELAAFETLRAAGAIDGAPSASSMADLERYQKDGFLYLVEEGEGAIAGYAGGYLAPDAEAGNWLHIAEMDVHPNFQRRGHGRRLIAALLAAGRERELQGASLTTDRLAPFNAPFYASMGFQIVEAGQCPPRLRRILQAEVEAGLDPSRRIAMIVSFQHR